MDTWVVMLEVLALFLALFLTLNQRFHRVEERVDRVHDRLDRLMGGSDGRATSNLQWKAHQDKR